jgi:ribonuclease P protein component
MRRGAEFTSTVRGGSRAAARSVVVHWTSGDAALHVGFVVGRAVGGAVSRNRVRRRLRHLVRDRLGTLPSTGSLVVRGNPSAAAATAAGLARDLDTALDRLAVTVR